MKKLKIFILLIVLIFWSCERDDICAESTQTTARLLIEFYDISSPDDLKSVPRLTAYGEGLPDPDPPIAAVDETLVFNTNSNALALPLLIGDEGTITTSRFILEQNTNLRVDEDNTTESNTDIIEVSYSNEFQYVSRACGFSNIFNNLDIDLINTTGDANWIIDIEIVETRIENENSLHVRILH